MDRDASHSIVVAYFCFDKGVLFGRRSGLWGQSVSFVIQLSGKQGLRGNRIFFDFESNPQPLLPCKRYDVTWWQRCGMSDLGLIVMGKIRAFFSGNESTSGQHPPLRKKEKVSTQSTPVCKAFSFQVSCRQATNSQRVHLQDLLITKILPDRPTPPRQRTNTKKFVFHPRCPQAPPFT